MKWIVKLVVALLALLSIGVLSVSAQDDGMMRFVHVVPGVGEVDVYLDDVLSVTNLAYGESSNYFAVPVGTHSVSVRPAGLTTELVRQTVGTAEGQPMTLIASGIDPLIFYTFDDDFNALPLGVTRFRIVHAIEGAPAVDVTYEGQLVAQGLEYSNVAGGFDIEAGALPLTFSAGGTDLLTQNFNLVSNTSQFIVLYGTPNSPKVMTLNAPLNGDGVGYVRFVHAAGAGEVSIYANDAIIATYAPFGTVTEHLAFPAGDYNIQIRDANSVEVFLEADLTVENGSAVTLAAMGAADALQLGTFADDISAVSADTVTLNVINTIPDSAVSLTANGGAFSVNDVAYGSASDAVRFDPVSDFGTLTFTVGDQAQQSAFPVVDFYGGNYIHALVVLDTSGVFPQPQVIFAQTTLAQTSASVPGASDIATVVEAPEEVAVELIATEEVPEEVAVEPIATEEVPEEVAVEPTQEPIIIIVTATPMVSEVQPVEATAIPQASQQATAAPVTTVFDGPTGRVALDPDANLNLREYPSAEAFNLGQAPSGAVLQINGREGAPVDIDGNVLPVDGQDFVDPVTLLVDEDEDLDETLTWLNVTYNTPDGGQIVAWVLAQYLVVRDERGDLIKLREIADTVPLNRPGERIETTIPVPSGEVERLTVRTINLDPGATLNVRRTPEIDGEILYQLRPDEVATFVGVLDASELTTTPEADVESWAFIAYQPTNGGTIRGWVSTRYVQYQLNGEATSLEDLTTLGMLNLVSPEERGSVSADAQPIAQPTPDPVRNAYVAAVQVNADAALNLRRTPSAESEVLAQIPAQTQLIITGRTEDEAWLQTSYEGVDGWVASGFVYLTYNGFAANITDIPVITFETEDG